MPTYFWNAITAWLVVSPKSPSAPLFQKPRSSSRCWMRAVSPPPLDPTATYGYSGAATGTIAGEGAVVVGATVVVGAAVVVVARVVVGAIVVGVTVVGGAVVVVEAICVVVTIRGDDEAMIAVPPRSIVTAPRPALTTINRLRVELGRGPWGERKAARIGARLPRTVGRSGGPSRARGGPFGDRHHVRQTHRSSVVPNECGDVETLDQVGRRHPLARHGDADRSGKGSSQRPSIDAPAGQPGQRDRPVALGQALAIDADDQGHMGVARDRQSEGLPDGDLARRRGQQVVTTGDEVDACRSVVDDHRQVVGGHAVVAPQDDVGCRAGESSGHDVVDCHVSAADRNRTAGVRCVRRSAR